MSNAEATTLLDRYDALLVDLDGTLLLADAVIPHAPEALAVARERGHDVLIVTNNASRSPQTVADRLTERRMPCAADEIVTSPQAAAGLLSDEHPAGAPILIVGAAALADAVSAVGLQPVRDCAAQPLAVVQGFSPDVGWRELAEACLAIRAGASWIATNVDSTLPTDRGILPGNGSLVAALATATDQQPRVAGKPNRALLDAASARVGANAPLVIGDRLDTDIAAAAAAQMHSLMVLTGVSSVDDVVLTPPQLRPTYVSADLRGLTGQSRMCRLADYVHDDDLYRALADLIAN